jgi:hypothetical protein
MKKIDFILREIVNLCSKNLNIQSIVQFGSSTYSKNPKDVDLILISEEDIFSSKDILKLIKIIKSFEKKYSNIVFNFSGLDRKKKRKYAITFLFLGKKEFNVLHNPHDIIFFKSLIKDKNKKILFGKDLFIKSKIKLTNQHLFEILTVNQKHALRKSLDDERYRLESFYEFFKSCLRNMLINEDLSKKEDLIKFFRKKYKNKIKLPKESERILSYKMKSQDFENILEFSDNCLNYLSRSIK